ncbi:uncharacterized protein LOC133530980 [Cydia pomonella]|uniref:uncharacterized protein LOC133530980 n=1 Tax=Cydia pomonella TaxID=82600 RepID=UPI002ADD4F7D|nr:uncharacterized protein LOC133530980 [Cydia pomonella]
MKILPFISCLLLACFAAASEIGTVIVTENFFKEEYVTYTSEHDIVKIYIPFNKFNFQNDGPNIIFFVEADINNNEQKYKGLYVFKDGKATKVLDNGRDAVATSENVIYFGANDGIYKYNEADKSAAKHGTVTDNIIQLAHSNVTNTVYYLTANHEVFKLNNEATNSVKVALVKDVQALVFGYEGNMYYLDSNKNVYVFNDADNTEPKKVVGLPSQIDKLTLIAPLNGMEKGSVLLVDKTIYVVKPDATITRELRPKTKVSLEVELTAFGPQPTMIQFYAKDKKLYEFNLFVIMKQHKEYFEGF